MSKKFHPIFIVDAFSSEAFGELFCGHLQQALFLEKNVTHTTQMMFSSSASLSPLKVSLTAEEYYYADCVHKCY